jgi:predicted ATPase/DNA-binding CsgD family transcriptional regulator
VVVSPREAEVFDLVGEHLTHAEIGERLFISARTVESHVASLRRKLGMIDHRSLVRVAVESRSQRPASVLPQEASSFVGRLPEVREVTDAVTTSRVVSIVGAGGTGKTRLAIRAARELSVEEWRFTTWVDLAAVTSSSEISPTLAAALGVVEPGRRTHDRAVLDVLGQRTALLVLDNCEQILDEVALLVERLLATCPNVTFLLTSRIRLAVPHERVVQLGGLPVGSGEIPGAAVELFIERARAGGSELGVGEQSRVADICRAIDGMPLAIELAAARVASIGLDGVESGLGDHRSLLVGGARVQARHQSVSETVAWSYRLLTPPDQNVLARVSTFRRSFSATDAVAVVAYGQVADVDVAGALGRLTQHNLIEASAVEARLRYRTLETVRQFGADRLRAESDHRAVERHLEWCACAAVDLAGKVDGLGWADEVDAIADEVNAALASTVGAHGGVSAHEVALQLAGLLFARGRTTDSQNAFERAARLAETEIVEAADLALAAAVAKCRVVGSEALRLEELAAHRALAGGDVGLAVRCAAGSAELIARFGGMFDDPPPLERALALLEEAQAYLPLGPLAEFILAVTKAGLDPSRGIAELEDFVHTALDFGELAHASGLLDAIVSRHIEGGDLVTALTTCRRRLDLFESTTPGPHLALELKDAFHMTILTATGAGQLEAAAQLAEDHARLPFLRDEPDLALEEGIAPAALAGNWDVAINAGEAFLAGWARAGRPVAPGRALAPAALAMIHGLRGDEIERAAWLETLELIRGDDVANRPTGYDEIFAAIVELHHHRSDEAAHHLAMFQTDHYYGALFQHWHSALAAEAAVLAGHSDARFKVADAIAATEGNPVATALSRRARALHDGTTAEFESIAAELDDLGCPYQAARTLSLAGGTSAERGAARLKSLGATGKSDR